MAEDEGAIGTVVLESEDQKETEKKRFSVTTDAGAKIQP